jgi:hypothetical protein
MPASVSRDNILCFPFGQTAHSVGRRAPFYVACSRNGFDAGKVPSAPAVLATARVRLRKGFHAAAACGTLRAWDILQATARRRAAMRARRASWMIGVLGLVVLAGPGHAGTITIEEATYGGDGRYCSAVAYFAERCAGRESCTIEITPDAEPCAIVGAVATKTVQVRYTCGTSSNAAAASGSTLMRLSCSGVSVRSRQVSTR